IPCAQRKQLVEPQARKARDGDRREIGARSLDPEDARLAPGVVEQRLLRRRVAAALVCERAVGAEQVRSVDEALEGPEAGSCALVPAILRRRDRDLDELAHALTSASCRVPLSTAKRSRASRHASLPRGP